jgi:predicted aminopeptidase
MLIALGAAQLLSGCYVTKLATKQVQLWNTQRPISEVIEDDKVAEAERKRLVFTQGVLKQAKLEGLNVGESYSRYIALKGDAVSYTVQAAPPDKLELKTWWFPFVGSVPYLGFFEKEERDAEAQELRHEGFDVSVSSVAAFSSLGWFSDPIYSTMLKRTEVELAEVIFHELVHRTLWVNGSVEFNENLAEFLGEHLAKDYFVKIGRTQELELLDLKTADHRLFVDWLNKLKAEVTKLYETMPSDWDEQKIKIYDDFLTNQKPQFKKFDFVGTQAWNNARLMAASLYVPDTKLFASAYKCAASKTAGEFLQALESRFKKSDPMEALQNFCKK